MDPQELTRLIREKQSNLNEKVRFQKNVGGVEGHDVTEVLVEFHFFFLSRLSVYIYIFIHTYIYTYQCIYIYPKLPRTFFKRPLHKGRFFTQNGRFFASCPGLLLRCPCMFWMELGFASSPL